MTVEQMLLKKGFCIVQGCSNNLRTNPLQTGILDFLCDTHIDSLDITDVLRMVLESEV